MPIYAPWNNDEEQKHKIKEFKKKQLRNIQHKGEHQIGIMWLLNQKNFNN